MKEGKPYVTLEALESYLVAQELYSPMVQRALAQSVISHGTHTRDDGSPYLEQHIFPMAIEVCSYCAEEERERAVITVLLHDVLEDDTITDTQLEELFGSVVCKDVEWLTKEKQNCVRTQEVHHEEHEKFVSRLKNAPLLIQKIKLIDRVNNLVCTECCNNPEKYERFLRDTEEYYLPFAQQIDQNLAMRIENEVMRLKIELAG